MPRGTAGIDVSSAASHLGCESGKGLGLRLNLCHPMPCVLGLSVGLKCIHHTVAFVYCGVCLDLDCHTYCIASCVSVYWYVRL